MSRVVLQDSFHEHQSPSEKYTGFLGHLMFALSAISAGSEADYPGICRYRYQPRAMVSPTLFFPSWRSMGTRDDQCDVVCWGGPTEFLHLCLNNGQEFAYRQASILLDEFGEPHFAILLTLWIRCLGHSV